MADVILKPQRSGSKTRRYAAQFEPMGDSLPRRQTLTAADMLRVKPGPAATFPVGTDTNTPGFPRRRAGHRGGLARHGRERA